MRIESQSLPAYVRGLPRDQRYDQDQIKRVWKEILRFPSENWDADSEPGDRSESILDPSRTLARMLCVKVDRHLENWISSCTQGISQRAEEIRLSWALRIADEAGSPWDPGEVLICIRNMTNGYLQEEFEEIRLRFPELFEGKDLHKNGADNECVKRVEELVKESYEIFLGRQLMHISAPKFHKVWDRLLGKDNEDLPIPEYPSEKEKSAKQQWSMTANRDFEWFCKQTCDKDGSVMLQTGGGHVLILTPIVIKAKSDEMQNYAGDKLNAIKESFKARPGQDWSPLLWASWDKGEERAMPEINVSPDDLVEHLADEHGDWAPRREIAMQRWSHFKFGKPNLSEESSSGNPAVFYLDVMGLGNHCWPPTQTRTQSQGEYDDWQPPTRKRQGMIDGFLKSRGITPVIESTFGLVFSKHFPKEVSSMGGDEIVVKMDKSNWLPLVQSVEKHCLKLHSSIFPEEPRLLWWALCREVVDGAGGIQDNDLHFSGMKEALRLIQKTEGPDKKVKLTRFVNPMFIDP